MTRDYLIREAKRAIARDEFLYGPGGLVIDPATVLAMYETESTQERITHNDGRRTRCPKRRARNPYR